MNRKIFTVNLYNYLSEDKAKVCKNYQDRNRELIEKYSHLGFDYVQVDSDEEIDNFVNSLSCSILYISLNIPFDFPPPIMSQLHGNNLFLFISPDK